MNTNNPYHPYLGAIIVTLSFMCLAVSSAFSKLAANQAPAFAIAFFQFITCLILYLPLLFRQGIASIKTTRLKLHLVRGMGGVVSYTMLLASLKTIPLINATLLLNTAPLWIPLILALWLQVKVRLSLWISIIIGFIGVLLILQPKGGFIHVGTLLALIAGMVYGFTMIVVRQLKCNEPTYRIIFYFFCVGALATFPLVVSHWQPLSLITLGWIVAAGASYFLCQILFTYAFHFAEASTLGPLAYTTVVFAGILDILIWHRLPTFWTLVGMILVVIGGVTTIMIDKKKALPKKHY